MSSKNSQTPELASVVQGASLNILGALSRSLLSFVFVFVLARILTTPEMGLFFLAVNIIMVVAILGIAGLDAGLRRFVSIAHGRQDDKLAWSYYMTAMCIAVPLVLLLAGMLYLFSDYLAIRLFSKPDLSGVVKMMIPFLVLYAAAELFLSVTQGYKHMKYWVLCLDVLNNILRIVFVIGLSYLGMTLYGAVVGHVLAIFLSCVLAYHYFRKVMPRHKVSGRVDFKFRQLAAFSFPVSLARLANSGNGFLETILLGYFLTSSEIGIYIVAFKIAVVGNIFLASFNTMFAPLISQLHAQGQLEELQRIFSSVTRWTFSLSLPVFILVAWYATPITSLFGVEYQAGATAVVVLCLGQLASTLTGPSGNLLLMSGYTYTNLWTNAFGLAMMIILIIILVPSYGVVGCSAAVAITITSINITRMALAHYFLGMHPYDMGYWKPVLAGALLLLGLAILGPDRHHELGFWPLIATGLVATLLYGFALLGLGLNETDRYMVSKVRQRLGRG